LEEHQNNEYTIYLNSRRRIILLHSQVWKSHFVNCKFIKAFNDLHAMEIAIQPITNESSEYYIIPDRYRQRTASININNIMRLFKLNNIDWPSGRYLAIWDDHQKWLTIKLTNYLGGDKGRDILQKT